MKPPEKPPCSIPLYPQSTKLWIVLMVVFAREGVRVRKMDKNLSLPPSYNSHLKQRMQNND